LTLNGSVSRRGWRSASVAAPILAIALLLPGLVACGKSSDADPFSILEGEGIYKAECASCHGQRLEGQPDWRIRRADGKLPAPPHDASGHTWHHPKELLVAITKLGMVPPHAPPGYQSDMPAFGGKLTDRQISNVLSYIESTWPAEIRAQRAQMLAGK
jgi:mono/diheme cytochrome c family protein